MATTTRVTVPKEVGDEIVIRYDGDDPTSYKVTDGHVAVEPDRVDRFLSLVEGSKTADAGTSGAAK